MLVFKRSLLFCECNSLNVEFAGCEEVLLLLSDVLLMNFHNDCTGFTATVECANNDICIVLYEILHKHF